MKDIHPARNICMIWIDRQNRIVSFREADGFEPRIFSTPEERLAFALEKCSDGYRVWE